MAKTPTMDRLYKTQAHSEVDASGESVGLPPGIMGNSEVGHLTIGAGRVIYQDVMRITKAIEKSDFSRNPALLNAIRNSARPHAAPLGTALRRQRAQSHRSSDRAARSRGEKWRCANIAVHAVLDGRDKPPRSALPFIDRVEAKLKELGRGRIATVSGRYYAMDRDKRWERVERAWRNIVEGEAPVVASARAGGREIIRGRQER